MECPECKNRATGRYKVYFYDTESIGFHSPTVLIQYAIGDGPVIIHNIFEETAGDTIALIDDMMDNYVIGFNLSHDHFHLSRTYGVLKMLPQKKIPSILDFADCEFEDEAHDTYCLKPRGALDLMIYGRKNELQATMNQKDIIIRKVPKILAEILVKELDKRVKIPPIYFAKKDGKRNWKIKALELDTGHEITPEEFKMLREDETYMDVDPNFVNIRLSFHPSTGLKPIAKFLLGIDADKIDDMVQFKRPTEYTWRPDAGEWLDVAQEHIDGWSTDPRRLKYAIADVDITRGVFKHFGSPYHAIGDTDSMLACSVGSLHWKGYQIDLDLAKEQLKIEEKAVNEAKKEVNFNSPKKVKAYIKEACNPIEQVLITDATEKTLEGLLESGSDEASRRARLILDGRRADKKRNLLDKLIKAGRLYATYKVLGTKSNRMSGGSMEGRGGSINPQGIKKGSAIRNVFTLCPDGFVLGSGDFDGFEVSISEAVYGDENLRQDLLSGKSIHALWGASLYGKTYEEIKATDGIPATEPEGFYARAKNSFFAQLYGAETPKIAEITGLSEDEVYGAKTDFEQRYPGIGIAREKLYKDFEAMYQPNGIGTAIHWKEPAEYAESFLGFRRYFTLEFETVRALFDLAQNPTEEMREVGEQIKVKRKDRIQTGYGACQSAVYSAAFGIQSGVIRAALNHLIQSPGGQMTKELQARIWVLQPTGIGPWKLMPMNIHDEIQCPSVPELSPKIKTIVDNFIEEYKELVPLIGMTWQEYLSSWGDKGLRKDKDTGKYYRKFTFNDDQEEFGPGGSDEVLQQFNAKVEEVFGGTTS